MSKKSFQFSYYTHTTQVDETSWKFFIVSATKQHLQRPKHNIRVNVEIRLNYLHKT